MEAHAQLKIDILGAGLIINLTRGDPGPRTGVQGTPGLL